MRNLRNDPTRSPTKAAETIALHVRVAARKDDSTIDLTMCEEVVSELRGGHSGIWLQMVARRANPKTVLRYARAEEAKQER